MSRLTKVVAVVGIAAGVAAAAGGATYAASSSRTLLACANSKGDLTLLSAKGTCAKHYSKVSLNQRGPRGATGKSGRAGARGPQGPGAVDVFYRPDTADSTQRAIAKLDGFTVYGQCNYSPGQFSSTVIYLLAPSRTTFDVTGPVLTSDLESGSTTSGIIAEYDRSSTSPVPIDAATGSAPTSPTSHFVHDALALGPMTVRGTAPSGAVTTFTLSATMTTDAGPDDTVDSNEGRCRIDGSLVPTR